MGTCFLYGNGGSGGASLNFKVVGGTTQPENPGENTIWVNTDTEITSWSFSDTEPESPEDGLVWIKTRFGSSTPFNALKKNEVQVFPFFAKQYVGGELVANTSRIYQGGAWKELILYLYNKGNECTDLTGGWAATATKPSGSGSTAVSPAVTKKHRQHYHLFIQRLSKLPNWLFSHCEKHRPYTL